MIETQLLNYVSNGLKSRAPKLYILHFFLVSRAATKPHGRITICISSVYISNASLTIGLC